MKRIALFTGLILFGLLVGSLAAAVRPVKWVRVRDGYRVHERRVNRYGNVLGEFYELTSDTFIATCYPGEPIAFATKEKARMYVEGCEAWE